MWFSLPVSVKEERGLTSIILNFYSVMSIIIAISKKAASESSGAA